MRLRAITILLALVAIATTASMIALWPSDERPELPQGSAADTERAGVLEVTESQCAPPAEGICSKAEVRIETGPDAGATATLDFGGAAGPGVGIDAGDEIRVVRSTAPAGVPGGSVSESGYAFVDFERRGPMLWLAGAFIVLVCALGRRRGFLSLLGLAGALTIVLGFVVPAILSGSEPVAVAVAGALAAALITIPLAHGWSRKSAAALMGTTLTLLVTAGLALAFVELTKLTGYSFDEAIALQQGGADISFRGILLAGMVIGALGVLDDVTVSQASTVFAIRGARVSQGAGELFRRAMEVGRDHLSSTVNTLALAYAGAALPVLLVFGSLGVSFTDALNLEVVSREVVAMLVGSLGLILAVPVTTALAVWLAGELTDEEAAALPAGHGH